MALTPDALDQVQRAFSSAAALALQHPDRTSREQYGHIAQLGKTLVDHNRGDHANDRGQTPLGLLAELADKSSAAAQIVRQFDARPDVLRR